MAVPFFFSLLLMLVKILHFSPPWLKMCGRLGSSFSSWRSKTWYPFCRWWKMKGVGGFFSRLCERILSVGGGGLLSYVAGRTYPLLCLQLVTGGGSRPKQARSGKRDDRGFLGVGRGRRGSEDGGGVLKRCALG